jgi:hypothetical protein
LRITPSRATTEDAVPLRLGEAEFHHPVVARVSERFLVGAAVEGARDGEGQEHRRGVGAPERRRLLVEVAAHLVQLAQDLEERFLPVRPEALEELGLLDGAALGILHRGLLELIDLPPDVFEELSDVADGTPPLRRKSLPALPADRQSLVQVGAQMQMRQIEYA